MSAETSATLVSIWRYPVKSMVGEELNASVIGVQALLAQGDLPLDPGIFKQGIMKNLVTASFAGKPLPSIGVYARVVSGGTVHRGEAVSVE